MRNLKLNAKGIAHYVAIIGFAIVFGIAGVGLLVASHADKAPPINPSLHVSARSYCLLPENKPREDFIWPQSGKAGESYKIQVNTSSDWSGNVFTATSTGSPTGSLYPDLRNYLYQSIADGNPGETGVGLHLIYPNTYYVRVYYPALNQWSGGTDNFQPLSCAIPPVNTTQKTQTSIPSGKPAQSTPTTSGNSQSAASSNSVDSSKQSASSDQSANKKSAKQQSGGQQKSQSNSFWAKVKNFFDSVL